MKPTKLNFTTSVRDAITQAGYSYTKALNVVNSELGKLAKTSTGEDKTGDVKVKIPKTEGLESSTSVRVQPGAETWEVKGTNAALMFVAWNDAIAKAEKLCPTMELIIPKDTMFDKWLSKVAMPDKVKEEQSA